MSNGTYFYFQLLNQRQLKDRTISTGTYTVRSYESRFAQLRKNMLIEPRYCTYRYTYYALRIKY